MRQRPHFPTWAVLILVLGLSSAVVADTESGKIPITTTSPEAKKLFLQGRELVENVRFPEGRVLFREAVEIDPDFALGHLYVANFSETFNEYLEAMARAEALKDRVSEGERLMIDRLRAAVDGNQVEFRRLSTRLVELYPKDERVQYAMAQDYAGQQENDRALEYYRKAVAVNPEFAPPYNEMGYLLRRMEQLEEAEKSFLKYIELIPDDPNPYDSYAELLLKMGRHDESIAQYQKALDLDPAFAISRFGISTNLCMKGDYESAHAQLDTALATSRDDTEKRAALTARMVVFVDEGKMEEALTAAQSRHDIAAANKDTLTMSGDLRTLGVILMESGQYDKAHAKFTAARDLVLNSGLDQALKDQSSASFLLDAARIHMYRGDFASARQSAEEYRQYAHDRENANLIRAAHALVGMIAVEEGNFDLAISELEKANQRNPYTLYRLARAYLGAGDTERARDFCNRVTHYNAVNNFNYSLVRGRAKEMHAGL